MPEPFPPPTDSVVASLIELFKHQDNTTVVRVLESATPTIELIGYDNWNGGTDIYSLVLSTPLKLFAVIEPERDKLQKTIERKLSSIVSNQDNAWLNTVKIKPILKSVGPQRPLPKASDEDLNRIWDDGFLRLFLSHISTHKVTMSKLKKELWIYGVSGFVAHEDIEPAKEWVSEIELALNSAHALAALLTPDFHDSKWTDQEVGVAFARGILIVPIRLGYDPYGFMGRTQAFTGDLEKVDALASGIVTILLKHPATTKLMHEVLTVALERAWSYVNAKKLSVAIIATTGFTLEQLERIREACKNNDQVKDSFGAPERINRYLAQFQPKTKASR